MRKVALITGASTGIGRQFAEIHADRGGDLIVVARNRDKLESLKAEVESKHSVQVAVIAKDLSQRESAQQLYHEVKGAGIEVDYLINNAGFGGHGKFHEQAWADSLAMIQLNLVTLAELCRLFLPDFVARSHGRILNVSSTASLVPGPLHAVYYATKAYVTSFSNALAEELHDTSVTVTALLPGPTETEFARTSRMEQTDLFAKTASPKLVALDGYDGMLAGKLNVISGASPWQRLMLTMIPFTPKKILLRQVRKMQEYKS
jgi:short-subunit dehydrogenase